MQSIEVEYPERSSWTSGTNWWMLYWFVVSLITELVSQSTGIWSAAMLAQVALAIVLILKRQMNTIR